MLINIRKFTNAKRDVCYGLDNVERNVAEDEDDDDDGGRVRERNPLAH